MNMFVFTEKNREIANANVEKRKATLEIFDPNYHFCMSIANKIEPL